MTPQQILGEVRRRGITISVNRGRLRLSPAELLDADLKDALARHKTVILQLLAGPALDESGLPFEQCRVCGSPNFWATRAAPDWRCSSCHERPQPFHGLSFVVAGGEWGKH